MKIKTLNRDVVEFRMGYRPFTTFFEDFSIEDNFGINAIKDTYNRAFNEWEHDYKYLTEFVMVLCWKIKQHHKSNEAYTKVYNELYHKANDYALENLKGKELQYFYRTTDLRNTEKINT